MTSTLSRLRPFAQVDVFSALPYRGNPLAVVLDGQGLDTETMQQFTNWTNLSEATFVLPPTQAGADYRVRIFCPGRELPFAGHPTLGTCHAWLQARATNDPAAHARWAAQAQPLVVQECGVGLITIRASQGALAFAAPPLIRSGPLPEDDVRLIALGLGIPREDIVAHAWCDNGPNWRGVMLRSAEQVLALQPKADILAGLDVGVVGPRGKVGVVAPSASGAATPDADFEVRAFFPTQQGMSEDPVTGSLNAALAQWLMGAGLAPERYIASQGTQLGRAGRVYIERDAQGVIWVGGHSVTCVDGQVLL